MHHLRFALLAVVAFALPIAAFAQRPTLETIRSYTGISEPKLSHDGRAVAYVTSVGDYQHDKWKRSLIVTDSDGHTSITLYRGASVSDPQWSPDDRSVYFVADDKDKTSQIYFVHRNGGAPKQLTHSKTDVEQYALDPRGARIVYVCEDEPTAAESQRHENLWSVGNNGYLQRERPMSSHLWLIGAHGGAAKRLTSGSWTVLETIPPFVGAASDPVWSADGSHIAFTMQADAYDSDSDKTRIAFVDPSTGRVSMADDRHNDYEYQPAFGTGTLRDSVAFIYPHGPGPISVMNLYVSRAGQLQNLSNAIDLDIDSFAWLPGGDVLFHAPTGIHSQLYVLHNGTPSPVDTHGVEVGSYDAGDTGAIAFVGSTTSEPGELYVTDASRSHIVRLTSYNARPNLEWGRTEEFRWTSRDGKQCDGVLTYPPGFESGKKYPLVLRIHGGPESSSLAQFSTLRQLFASRGYIVLEPNYRGSDNLGTEYEHAIYRDAGTGPGNDVMDGIAALEARGIVDTTHEAVTGHSYGGFMTTWLISHDSRWRSAVVGDGMVDWTEEYDLSGTGNLAWARDSFGGSPWDPTLTQMYRDQSPISYVRAIKTPTRIISGTSDVQVPASESYELFHALRDQGVTTDFIAIPGALHFPSDPVHIEGYNRVTLEWVDRFMR